MRIAVSIWKDRVSPVFDVSQTLLVMDIEDGVVTGHFNEVFSEESPAHKLSRLCALKVDTLICGAISRPVAELLDAGGIATIPFIAGEKDAVIEAFLSGTLPNPDLTMPGAQRKDRGRHTGKTGGHRMKRRDASGFSGKHTSS